MLHLSGLLEEAFPPDWRARPDPSIGERLRLGLSRRDESQRTAIQMELRELLGRGLCEMQLSDVVSFELGCHLRPAEMNMTTAEWLVWLEHQIEGSG